MPRLLAIEDLELPDISTVTNPLTKKLISAVDRANKVQSALPMEVYMLEGMSTPKGRCLLNNLCADPSTRYMEIGCWKGSTLISALYGNNPEYHVAIENFKECGTPEGKHEVYDHFKQNCMRVLGKYPNHLNQDSFEVDVKKEDIKDINVYFYDGCHTRDATRRAITHYYDALADEFILLIDDWNRAAVSTGAIEGINDMGIKMDFIRILPANGDGDFENWWSGMFAASCKKR